MKFSKKIFNILGWSEKSDDFIIGKDNFSDLQINSTPAIEQFYYFFYQKDRRLIKQFVLNEGKQVDYICRVTLIKKDEKFTPRLSFSVRDNKKWGLEFIKKSYRCPFSNSNEYPNMGKTRIRTTRKSG